MRFLLFSILIAWSFAFADARAQQGNQTSTHPIESIISKQIAAFKRDDAKTAFSFASPMIQKQFRTPEFFLEMVARGYPQVYRPKSFRFTERAEVNSRTLQKVVVVGPSGAEVTAIYEMMQIDGQWRINGCQILKPKGQDV
ncbi:MAG: DUF4864 domain-containing protein [Pseudomonadota bacterium]